MHTSVIVAALSALTLSSVDAGACKPVDMIMTRASGTKAEFENGTWSTGYGLSSVNTASLYGALKFVIAEAIDIDTGYTNDTDVGCHRKSKVNYIHFYKFTICNPDDALWWYNYREDGYGGDEAYGLGEYGHFVTFDGGECHHSKHCEYFHGENSHVKLGPYVGWQDNTNDPRNPTDESYWYSLPGECPNKPWKSKSGDCKAKQKSGLCPAGVVPDGETCTWSYEMLGQVVLDDLVGITNLINPSTGLSFTNSSEFCLAGEIEFKRDPKTNDFVQGLDFWKDPLDRKANKERVDALLEYYIQDPDNKPLPLTSDITKTNPRCFSSAPKCFLAGKETCTRDIEQLCVSCDKVEGGCAAVTNPKDAFDASLLSKVELPPGGNGNGGGKGKGDGSDDDDDSSNATGLNGSILLFIAMALTLRSMN